MTDLDEHFRRLPSGHAATRPGSTTRHVVVMLPSYSVADSLLRHYASRLLELEHRHLLHVLTLSRVPDAEMIFVTSVRPTRQVVDYYLSLMPPAERRDVRARLRFLEVPDTRPLSITTKLLERPDLVARLRRMVGGRPGLVEPWNVTRAESRLARRVGLPLNGSAPRLWRLGFKSRGRKIMRKAGVPLPVGAEDVRSAEDVVRAFHEVRARRPDAEGVVVKTDDSGGGDGNRVLRFADLPTVESVRATVESWDSWYLDDLSRGGVVEENLARGEMSFPSVQVNISATGAVEVVSTHEQVLEGETGHVYAGCRFPAEALYRAELARHGHAVGRVLAERGARGRLSVDFAAVRGEDRDWRLFGLEINLRKTGTTHPFAVLSSLVPGRYAECGRWVAADGVERCYRSTDTLRDPTWLGRAAEDVIETLREAGLEFDRGTGTGVVLHMLCGLDLSGRIGLTALGTSPLDAERLYHAAVAALSVPEVSLASSIPDQPVIPAG